MGLSPGGHVSSGVHNPPPVAGVLGPNERQEPRGNAEDGTGERNAQPSGGNGCRLANSGKPQLLGGGRCSPTPVLSHCYSLS